jgi:hypothetical protein
MILPRWYAIFTAAVTHNAETGFTTWRQGWKYLEKRWCAELFRHTSFSFSRQMMNVESVFLQKVTYK